MAEYDYCEECDITLDEDESYAPICAECVEEKRLEARPRWRKALDAAVESAWDYTPRALWRRLRDRIVLRWYRDTPRMTFICSPGGLPFTTATKRAIPGDTIQIMPGTYEMTTFFPLYRYGGALDGGLSFLGAKEVNFSPRFGDKLESNASIVRDTPETAIQYAYALFYSPTYRTRYAEFLKNDFPRILLPAESELFNALAGLGSELVALHLLESPKLNNFVTTCTGPKSPEVGRVGWSDDTVWLDAGKTNAREGHRATKPGTIGFRGVPEAVWNFHIGGYQVCHKWLKDRKGRTLSKDDIRHYQKIVTALSETIRLMQEIDEVIEQHGGWPGAFQTDEAQAAVPKVIPFRPRIVQPGPKERYATCVPLVPLKAAAGAFGDPQQIDEDELEWTAVDTSHRLRPGMFVAQVVGKSMEPAIPDGAYCLFAGPVEGTQQGKTVLVKLRDSTDPETGQRYTVKRYESEKTKQGDSWRHSRITLKPVNPDFAPIVLTGADEGALRVVAELVEVLADEALGPEE